MSVCQKRAITVYTGEDKTLEVNFLDEDGSPLALGSPDEITFSFYGRDGTIQKTQTGGHVSIVSADAGKVTVEISNADLLRIGPGQDFWAAIDQAGKITKVQFKDALNVVEAL